MREVTSLLLQGVSPGLIHIVQTFTKRSSISDSDVCHAGLKRLVFCLVSSIRCKNGMNHLKDRVPHMADGLCQYSHQYNNKVLICKVRLTPDTSLVS